MSTRSPKISEFASIRDLLWATLEARKQQNSRYSVLQWSRELGFRNSSLLNEVLHGRRPVSAKMLVSLTRDLNINISDRDHFQVLCRMSSGREKSSRSIALKHLERTRSSQQAHQLKLEKFRAIGDWMHLALLEATGLKNFRFDIKELTRRLPGQGAIRIELAIERLERLGLLVKRRDGSYTKGNAELKVGDDLANEAVRQFHQQGGEIAIEALRTQSPEFREFAGTTIAISKKDLPRFKAMIQEFHDRVRAMGVDRDGDHVYRLNTQFFRIME